MIYDSLLPVCLSCRHFKGENTGEYICAAFPKGIPEEIQGGYNDHKEVLEGQENNIVFESTGEV